MQPSSSATLPRGFRFHYQDGERPSTPEAMVQAEPQAPALPRARLRVKRRNVSNISGPTEQFLASVAAAEVPLPSIEGLSAGEDVQMFGSDADPVPDLERLAPRSADFRPLPLRTTTPTILTAMDAGSHHRRDWYSTSGSTFDDVADRPSSALSYHSDSTDSSFFSNGQFPRLSEDGSCTSPDSDFPDPFIQVTDKSDPFVTRTSAKGKEPTFNGVLNGQIRSRTRHDAPWSIEMSVHLWLTYQVYLQDATVTPFRVGPYDAPPEGVVHRVAREAKRSWKGPRPVDVVQSTEQGSPDTVMTGSGSVTPTVNAEESKVYLQWHHSGAATRSHLRELCRQNGVALSYRHLQSNMPTPFTERHQYPAEYQAGGAYTPGAFSVAHMQNALPLEGVQPDGPSSELANPRLSENNCRDDDLDKSFMTGRRAHKLGSPFAAQTYGPSSSKAFWKPSPTHGKSGTIPTSRPYLASPFRPSHRQSLNGSQKRRAQNSLEDEFPSRRALIRPSILDEQLFGTARDNQQRRVRSRGFSLGDESLGNRVSGLFNAQGQGANSTVNMSVNSGFSSATRPDTSLLPAFVFRATRPGTPGAVGGINFNTLPGRLPQQVAGASTFGQRAATVHHTRRSIESFDFGNGPSLQSRLAQLDEMLNEIRDREANDSKQPEQ